MSFEIKTSTYFDLKIKKLSKRHKSLKDDLKELRQELTNNPSAGVEIAPYIRKVRMSIKSKGRGKSAGARVITYDALVCDNEGTLYLLLIYDKSDATNVKMNVIEDIIKELLGE